MKDCEIFFTREVCEREGVLTVIQASYMADEAAPRVMVSLQSFRGDGASCQTILVHPDTARALSKILIGVADKFDQRVIDNKEK